MLDIPFSVYVRIDPPYNGERMVYVRAMEKMAKRVADDISSYLESNPGRFAINKNSSVSVSPQFGENPAKLTITGFDNPGFEDNFQPATRLNVDAPYTKTSDNYAGVPGRVVKGFQSVKQPGPHQQELDYRVQAGATALKEALESASPNILKPEGESAIFKMDYMGVLFGQGGYSFA